MNEAFKLAPHEWALLRALLEEALALSARERAAWLERLDESRSAGLKPRLASLLANASDRGAEGGEGGGGGDGDPGTAMRLLDTLPKVETGQFASPPGSGERVGDLVGPYRLVRELGSGGMGSVWLAERTDMLQGRQVALKLPHGAWKRAGLAERLEREREILATLEHPNIARLYDAGVTPEGQPWLALEYVAGQRIDVHCKEGGLALKERLRLFLQVARAVAYAHTALVVHRDLKPANILVTSTAGGRDEVKLLDFGIAKLATEGVVEETELTREAGRAFTPEYASPEQILGRPLGTASDVYSLGVVLFELLAEARPYRLHRGSRAALEEAVAAAVVPRPSAVAPPQRRRALRGDLDTVVLKALKRDPAERYATVAALADDVQRLLEQRPVLAQPDSAWYRVRTFVQRNRWPLAGTAVTGLALLGGTLLFAWQASVARAEQRRADEVKNFIAQIFREANPYRGDGKSASAADLLQRAVDKLALIDPARVAMRVELMNLIGASLLSLQESDSAEAVVLQAVGEARSLPPQDALALEARSLLVSVHRFRGRTREMKSELEELVPLLRANAAREPAPLVQSLKDQAHLAIDEGRFEQAVAASREATELATAALGPDHPQTASCWLVHGLALLGADRTAEALAASGRALEMTLKVNGGNTAHLQVANARVPYARALAANDRLDEAIAEMRRAISGASATLGPRTRQIGFFTQNLVRLELDAGQVLQALASSELALSILSEHAQPESSTVGAALSTRALAHLEAYDGAPAARDFSRALAVARKVLGANHDAVLRNEAQYLAALGMAGRGDEALPRLRALAADAGLGSQRSGRDRAYWYAFAARLAGADDIARSLLASNLEQRAHARDTAQGAPRWALERAHGHLRAAQLDDAEHWYRAAMAGSQATLINPRAAEARLGLARVLLERGRAAEALPLLEQVDAFWTRFQPSGRWAGEAAHWLAQAEQRAGDPRQAARHRLRAERLLALSRRPADRATRR
jgi:serine/threonine-protein kinase